VVRKNAPHKFTAIPEPVATVEALYATVLALREAVQTLNGQRDPMLGALTYQDAALRGWIKESEAPTDGGFLRSVPLSTSNYVGPNT
jgi:hypothetical protein